MKNKNILGYALAGFSAGAVTGLFGAGGGMILVPLLSRLTDLPEDSVFPSSISIILPICLATLPIMLSSNTPTLPQLLPYLLGSAVGGILSGFWGKHIPTLWLHRLLGILILWGGIRYLC